MRFSAEMSRLLQHLKTQQASILQLLSDLVALESPSDDKASVDQLGAFIARRIVDNGLQSKTIERAEVGDLTWTQFGQGDGGVLFLCHIDTVWPRGSLQRNPCRVEDGRFYGPGVYDMKAGVAATLVIQQLLVQGHIRPKDRVRFLYTTDEEIASLHSRSVIEAFARDSRVVLVPEPPLPGGGIKTFRKGVAEFELLVEGRSAHAGLEPEKGVNALLELSHQIPLIQALSDPAARSTVNVTVARAGDRTNVIPDNAQARIDVRFETPAEGDRIDKALAGLRPRLEGAQVSVRPRSRRPPMVRTSATEQAAHQAIEAARELGFDLEEGSTGGGSDGSFTAAVGTTTLDGLGVNGDGAHALHEHIEVDWLAPRLALLARLCEIL